MLSGCEKGTTKQLNSNAEGQKPSQSASVGASGVTAAQPNTMEIPIILHGGNDQRTAQLSKADGYTVYVPEGLTFNSGQNQLTYQSDADYYATIYKFPTATKIDYLKFEADEEMSDVARVMELQGSNIPEAMRGVDLFEQAKGSLRTKQYIVKTIAGQTYVFRLDIPVGDAAEAFTALAYASLNTVQSQ